MYAALWRVLPGPWWVRVLILLVALALILFVLVEWVFPWVQTFVAPQDVTVQKK
jgi:predicted membrane protein